MKKKEAQQINTCHMGPFPAFVKDTEDGQFEVPLEEGVKTPLNEDDEPLEEGDFWATASISQRLAEGF